jgi:hypothetical protein
VDRPVDVRLGGEVDDRARPVFRQQRTDGAGIADIAAHEQVPFIAGKRRQASHVAGVRELVEIDERLAVLREPVEDEIGADESGAAGDEDHEAISAKTAASLASRRCAPPPGSGPRGAQGTG